MNPHNPTQQLRQAKEDETNSKESADWDAYYARMIVRKDPSHTVTALRAMGSGFSGLRSMGREVLMAAGFGRFWSEAVLIGLQMAERRTLLRA